MSWSGYVVVEVVGVCGHFCGRAVEVVGWQRELVVLLMVMERLVSVREP